MLNFIRSRHFARTVILFGMIAIVSFVNIAISSQYKIGGARADESPSSFQNRNACSVCGGWSVTVSLVGDPSEGNTGPRTFTVLTTFDAGGAVVETDRVTGLGSWNYKGEDRRQVVYTFLQRQFSAPANSYIGMMQATHYIVFNPTFDEFSGYSNVTRFSPDGKVEKIERAGKLQAFRIKADVPVGTKAAPNIP